MRRVLAFIVFLTALVPTVAFASEGGGLISLDKSLIIQAFNFLLLLFLLSKLLYKPLMAKMDERSQAIKKSLDEAQAARAQAQKERRQRAKVAPKAIENPEVAPARGHAAGNFSLPPFAIGQAATNPR